MTVFITCLAAVLVLGYLRPAGRWWIATLAAVLALSGYASPLPPVTLGLLGLLFLAATAVLAAAPLRRRLLTRALFAIYKKQLPSMSQTESEALEAGTTAWEAELFTGKPDWQKLDAIAAPSLTDEEQAFLDGPVEELCRMLDDWVITHRDQDLPPEAWEFIKQQRLFGMIIPRRYGGLEFSAQAHSDVVMKIATRSVTAAVTVMVPNSLGPAMLLLEYGTEDQKEYYLPRLAAGQEIPCFGLTSPEAGSDAGGMLDRGVVCRGEHDGEPDVLGISLNWNKRYITLSPVATLLGLAFKLYDPDHILGEGEDLGITLALIPTSHPGVETGRRHLPANVPFQNGPTSGTDVFIPMDWVIGGRERVGRGWRMLMECLSDGRGISLPALSTGAGKTACRTTGAYARVRRQFNLPVGRFEGVQAMLARMAGLTYLMNATRNLTLAAIDRGGKPAVATAIAKYCLTEAMRQVINDACDIHGGKAIMQGPRNYLMNAYQSIPIGITVEGSNILTRNMIIFGQGAIRCHPYVLDEIRATMQTDAGQALEQFDRVIFRHAGLVISNLIRGLLLGLSCGRLHQPLRKGPATTYYRQVTRMSAGFALLADASMLVLGGALKRRENLSARLADMLSNLYLCTAVLKQFHDQGEQQEDTALMEWSCRHCLHEVQQAMQDFLANFPNRPLALALKCLLFPWGRPYASPPDSLGADVADILLAPSAARDRLTGGIFLPEAGDEPLRQLETALQSAIEAEPVMDRLKQAMRSGEIHSDNLKQAFTEAVQNHYLDDHETEILRTAMQESDRVIAVDDFAASDFSQREATWQQT